MKWGSMIYNHLHVHVNDNDCRVVRKAREKLHKAMLIPAHREIRHKYYRAVLEQHHRWQDLCEEFKM